MGGIRGSRRCTESLSSKTPGENSGDRINVFHVHNDNPVLTFQRWLDGFGEDVIVALSLREDILVVSSSGIPNFG